MTNLDAHVVSHAGLDAKSENQTIQALTTDKFQQEVHLSPGFNFKSQSDLLEHRSQSEQLPKISISGLTTEKDFGSFNKGWIDGKVAEDLKKNALPKQPLLNFGSHGWTPEDMLKGDNYRFLGNGTGDNMGQKPDTHEPSPALAEYNKKASAATSDIDRKEDTIAHKKWDALPADKKSAIEKEIKEQDLRSRQVGSDVNSIDSFSRTPLQDAYLSSLQRDLAPLERERTARLHQVWNTLPKALKSEIYREQETSNLDFKPKYL